MQLDAKVKNLQNAPLFIDDTAAISLFELRSKCIRMKLQHNIGIVMIDYLQLMTGPEEVRGNREQEVSTISRGIKQLAKELNVPIIALSQLSRNTVARGGSNRPQLNDLPSRILRNPARRKWQQHSRPRTSNHCQAP